MATLMKGPFTSAEIASPTEAAVSLDRKPMAATERAASVSLEPGRSTSILGFKDLVVDGSV